MDNVLIITGASRGIGAATARLAAAAGYSICVNYRQNITAAEGVVRDLRAMGASAISARADASIERDVVRLFDTCDRQLGTLTALVNNTALLETQMRLGPMDTARVTRILATNVVVRSFCAREAVNPDYFRVSALGIGHSAFAPR